MVSPSAHPTWPPNRWPGLSCPDYFCLPGWLLAKAALPPWSLYEKPLSCPEAGRAGDNICPACLSSGLGVASAKGTPSWAPAHCSEDVTARTLPSFATRGSCCLCGLQGTSTLLPVTPGHLSHQRGELRHLTQTSTSLLYSTNSLHPRGVTGPISQREKLSLRGFIYLSRLVSGRAGN